MEEVIKVVGFDIGVTSIGWAFLKIDKKSGQCREIVDSGIRIFETAENPTNGKSLAAPRREARSKRRICDRKRRRMEAIKKIIAKGMQIPLESMMFYSQGTKNANYALPSLFETTKTTKSPWELRYIGLYQKLEKEDWARVLLHLAKHRGYDNITYGLDDSENATIGKEIAKNEKNCEDVKCQTIGEFMYREHYSCNLKVRNRAVNKLNSEGKVVFKPNGEPEKERTYENSLGRKLIKQEAEILFSKQREFCNPFTSKELEENFIEMAFSQRPLKSFEHLVGKCQFFKNELRACTGAASSEEFVAVSRIVNLICSLEEYFQKNNTTKLKTPSLFEENKFSFDDILERLRDRKQVIEFILNEAQKTKKGVSYAKVRKLLGIPSDYRFKDLVSDYRHQHKNKELFLQTLQEIEKTEKDTIFINLEKTHELRKVIGEAPIDMLDKIASILTANKDWNIIEKKLKEEGVGEENITAIKNSKLIFSKYLNLSFKAIYALLPLLKEGKRYDEAVELLRDKGVFPKESHKQQKLLPPLSKIAQEDSYFNISNPVVSRAFSEFRKVMNGLTGKYGKFHRAHLEFTREIGKSFADRSIIRKQQEENRVFNELVKKRCEVIGLKTTGNDFLHVKLWMEQDEYCPYSLKKITIADLKEKGKLQVDHIYPRSRSLDDSYNNKVLCLERCNRHKGDLTPYEWFCGNNPPQDVTWEQFTAFLSAKFKNSKQYPKQKLKRFYNSNFKNKNIGESKEFIERNLIDTGYIANIISKYLKNYLEFEKYDGKFLTLTDGSKGSSKHVLITNGQTTSIMRHYWGVGNKNRNNHLHHAEDAIIIACINDKTIKNLTDILKKQEVGFRENKNPKELQKLLEEKKKFLPPMKNFNFAVYQKVKEIFVSKRAERKMSGGLHEETVMSKVYFIKQGSKKYKDCGKKYGGEVGLEKALALGKLIEARGGIVKNDTIVRVDIFKSKTRRTYHVVPIYAYDVAKGVLPNKAIVVKDAKTGNIKDWLEMDTGKFEFCFSLFKNDLVEIQTKEMKNPIYAYYKGADSATAALGFEHHSGANFTSEEINFFTVSKKIKKEKRIGIQKLKVFNRCLVTPLGEIKQCSFAKRQPLRNIPQNKGINV